VDAGNTAVTVALPNLQARIDGLNAALAAPPPPVIDFASQLALANQIVTSVTAVIASGLAPPDITAQLANLTTLLTTLSVSMGTVDAQVTILAQLGALMLHAGLHVYAYEGSADGFGPAVTGELTSGLPSGGPGDQVFALGLVCNAGATATAMQAFFKVTP